MGRPLVWVCRYITSRSPLTLDKFKCVQNRSNLLLLKPYYCGFPATLTVFQWVERCGHSQIVCTGRDQGATSSSSPRANVANTNKGRSSFGRMRSTVEVGQKDRYTHFQTYNYSYDRINNMRGLGPASDRIIRVRT